MNARKKRRAEIDENQRSFFPNPILRGFNHKLKGAHNARSVAAGYPVVAEIEVMDADRLRFKLDLDKALRIIMFAPGAPIDDPDLDFEIDDIIFHVECYD